MADAAQRILLKEFKDLNKEKWTNIEVSACPTKSLVGSEHPANRRPAHQRERLRVERGAHCAQRGFHVLWGILQGQDDIPAQLPAQPTRYVVLLPLAPMRGGAS